MQVFWKRKDSNLSKIMVIEELMGLVKYGLIMSEKPDYYKTHTSFFSANLSRACAVCQAPCRKLGIQWCQEQHRTCPRGEYLLWRRHRWRCRARTEKCSLINGPLEDLKNRGARGQREHIPRSEVKRKWVQLKDLEGTQSREQEESGGMRWDWVSRQRPGDL